jgi:hypothetical protein
LIHFLRDEIQNRRKQKKNIPSYRNNTQAEEKNEKLESERKNQYNDDDRPIVWIVSLLNFFFF